MILSSSGFISLKFSEQVKPTESIENSTNDIKELNDQLNDLTSEISELDTLTSRMDEISSQKLKLDDVKTILSKYDSNLIQLKDHLILLQALIK